MEVRFDWWIAKMMGSIKRSFVIFLFLTSLLVSVASAETITFTDLGIATEFTSGKTGTTPVGIFHVDSNKDPLEISIRTYRIQVYKLTVYVNDAPIIESGQLAGGDGTLSTTLPPEFLKVGENTIYVKGTSMSRGNEGFGGTNHLVIYGTSSINSDSLYTPYGLISISSSPTDSNVFLDDAFNGVTPLTISDVPIGSHVIKLTKDGYHDKTKSVIVVDGDTASVSETLTQITGSIAVSSSPSNAYVYLGDVIKGTTPLTIDNVPIGTHSIKLTKDGYYNNTKSVIVTKDGMEKVSMSIEPFENAALVDTNAPDTSNNYGSLGGIGAFMLLLFFMVVIAIVKKGSKDKGSDSTAQNESVSLLGNEPLKIKRGYSVLPNNDTKFGIRLENETGFIITDIDTILDYNEDLFKIKDSKIQRIGNIAPKGMRTITYILKPLTCIHNEQIKALITYKDHTGKKQTLHMRSKEMHCITPHLKEKPMSEGEYSLHANNSESVEEGIIFKGISVEEMSKFMAVIYKNMLYPVTEYDIEGRKIFYLSGEAIGEKAYYLLTAVIQEYEGLTQVVLRAHSNKKYGLNGFMNEMADTIRHLVRSMQNAKEIGIIKNSQVINIIDSVVYRTKFEMGKGGNTQVNIKESVVHRPDIGAGADVDTDTGAGENVAEKKCPTCGTVAEGNGKFCNECGGKL